MSTALNSKRATFPRGVHPPEHKELAAAAAITVLPTPTEVRVPLLQHLGAPCAATVKPRQEVKLGEVVGEAKGFISSSVHATLDGTTGREAMTTLPNGRHVPVVPIKAAEEQQYAGEALMHHILGGEWPTAGFESIERQAIADAARAAGLVGLGGAGFPTHVKLTPNDEKPIDTLLINGCECEPFLTSDYRLMLEAPAPIVTGALLAGRATGAGRVIIAVEDNKPEAIQVLARAADGTGIELAVLQTKYPQGGEKQLILALTGKEVPTGGLPLDVGIVVLNVSTSAALARGVLREQPLTHRVVTVTGGGIAEPKNVLAPIGASYQDLIDFCGGLTPEAVRVVAGGPMMGFTLADPNVPVTKGTSGITVMTREDIRKAAETTCVRCGRCVDVCPMRLVPTKIALAARLDNLALAERYHMNSCMECGSCAYVCPASLPLVQLIRMGKAQARHKAAPAQG